jgi:hypothetical protein
LKKGLANGGGHFGFSNQHEGKLFEKWLVMHSLGSYGKLSTTETELFDFVLFWKGKSIERVPTT